ncbi:MAG: TOPRIM nucleotidyl transferase/hydrolase domain-containing protein [Aeromicrobium sp.]
MTRLRDAIVGWAAGGHGAADAGDVARALARDVGLRFVVLVEGESDRAAVETLALRRGRDLVEEAVCVVPLGGATSIARFVALVGPDGLGLRVAGMCDAAELGFFRRALEQVGLGLEGFFVCDADLEHELIRALGVEAVEAVVASEGELGRLRTFQQQPAQRGRPEVDRLHRFMGTHSGRKAQYGRALVEALALDRVPAPLDDLLAHVRP